HLGIASLNLGYGGESGGGSYHSAYDTFEHYTRFGDTTFAYGVALAQTAGRATLRLANADVLPLRMTGFVDNVKTYVDEVMTLAANERSEVQRRNELIARDAYRLAADPQETYVPPDPAEPVPALNFPPLQNALARLERAAAAYDDAVPAALAAGAIDASRARALNSVLRGLEHKMTRDEGLPRRPWFRHQIYAPGFYTGYGVKTLPGVREAIEEHDWDEANAYIASTAEVLERVAAEIERATAIVR